uniref:Uncharacterized protein n=1 Tax=Helianthus annuus TaxID=4232 RepID=A0A251RVK9_HELAN
MFFLFFGRITFHRLYFHLHLTSPSDHRIEDRTLPSQAIRPLNTTTSNRTGNQHHGS